MGLILMILAAVVVAVIVAIVIVKFVPLKMRWLVSILLLLASVFLGYKIYNGIMEPINFNIKKQIKYAKVIENLKIIRDAEIAHYEVSGNYTSNKTGLIQFIDTAQFAITEARDTVIKVDRGGGITEEVSRKKIDTIGYEPVLKRFENLDYKNMFKVPGLEGKEFDLSIGLVEKVAGLKVPVFYAKTDKEAILKGMSPSLIKIEKETIASDQIKGEFISVGSLDEVTTGGNWPPSYDKKDN